MNVLVTGATGYIGGRLVPRLLERGHRVRVLVRDPARIDGRSWAGRVEIAVGDLLDPASLGPALAGIEAAYYLVHSMVAGSDFEERDRQAAGNFVAAGSGLAHVVYLGGLQPAGDRISGHLQSRAEVGEILRGGLPATELRAGPIIGSGSASFEMVRYLTERLPAMIAPRWVMNEVQPISVRDILSYLLLALERAPAGVVEVGSDRLTFREMMQVYASVRGLRRLIVPIPVLTPHLAGLWVGLVTPIPNHLAVPLIEGVIRPVVADTSRARELFSEIEPVSYRRAVELALEKIRDGRVETRWSGALGGGLTYQLTDREGLIREVRTLHVPLPPERVFRVFSGLGGDRGWLVWGWAWRLRGLLDRLVGGPGLRRGRRDPREIFPGEALDFWRVEEVQPPHLLRLRAEMKVPGRAWLEWEAQPEGEGTRLVQTALFAPVGLAGTLYWYLLYPLHKRIFSDLIRAVGREAEAG
ncbi:MAG TPA: DUF2867 domain-containing protein [Thermoanaerobaculia bacterium]|nr:DUF2867 domain-containing protein [Thermoanaerobaculia bacterium]